MILWASVGFSEGVGPPKTLIFLQCSNVFAIRLVRLRPNPMRERQRSGEEREIKRERERERERRERERESRRGVRLGPFRRVASRITR